MLRQLKINSRKLALLFSNFSPLYQQHQSTKHSKRNPWQYATVEISKYIKLVSKMCDDRKISKISTRSRIASGYANACGSSPIISWVRSPSNEPPCLSNLLPMSTLNFSICRAPYFQHQRRHNFFENHEMPLLLHIHIEKSS